jgi:eukaryotic-like serine/threonine-protein kinase
MTARRIACDPCNFSLNPLNPLQSCRRPACGWRTRHPVDSVQTLIRDHTPPLRDHSPPAGALSEREVQAGSLLHGRYRLCERLGAGGFGVVWRAEDLQLQREVALKRIPLAPLAPGDAGEDRYELPPDRASREALATARLAHPAIVALYEAFVDGEAFHLVSELVHGDTLASLIAADALTDADILYIGLSLTQALEHAHARGVVHRDVKPHNVLVPRDRHAHEAPAKLTDFGGASLAGQDALTRPGDTLGTLAYMAPEQSEGREVTPAADLYSLALVLYEGLTGTNPVRGPNPAATARRIGRQLPPLATARPELSGDLTNAIDSALTVDPSRRGTLRDLHGALERALAGGLAEGASPTIARRSEPRGASRLVPAQQIHHRDPARATFRARAGTLLPSPLEDSDQGTATPHAATATPDPSSSTSMARPMRAVPLPRALWLGAALAGAVWLAASGLPGAALLLVAAAAPLLAMGSRPGANWLAAALAPALGLVGLAGAYPALAGQAGRWRTRATLGALGYWWLILAAPLLASAGAARGGPTRLWLAPPPGLPARTVWERSPDASVHVLGPALSTGMLLGAILWATAAIVLPWVVRGRGPLLDALAAVAWSAVLLAATPYFDGGVSVLSGATGPVAPRGAVVGAILAAAIAVAARALRGPVAVAHS